ncbi:enoyl-CoA hydratase/isomerase family protein [Sphingomonas flavalba]|uniref:enoyl-CoA hydratase/isomerase family protein n=1 Tax=Sphingomonas flavalba TaxID=2559804 RepID=UPI0039DFC1D1
MSEAPGDAPKEDLSQCVLYEIVEENICKITLNRPHRRNAIMTPVMNEMLYDYLGKAQDDDDVKVVVLAGNGPDFCAGEDTTHVPAEALGLKKGERLGQSRRMRGMRKTYETLQDGFLWSDKVVIGACHGAVMGVGFSFALGCDLLIASTDARFARRQARMGFAAFDAQMPIAMLKLGMNRAMEVLMTGRTVTPEELKDWGVANSVVPPDELEAEAMRYARAIAALSTDGLMLGKRAVHQFLHGVGMAGFQNFASIGHPLFTNLVWRENEFNFLRERNVDGNKAAWKRLNKIFSDLGFD